MIVIALALRYKFLCRTRKCKKELYC